MVNSAADTLSLAVMERSGQSQNKKPEAEETCLRIFTLFQLVSLSCRALRHFAPTFCRALAQKCLVAQCQHLHVCPCWNFISQLSTTVVLFPVYHNSAAGLIVSNAAFGLNPE